MVLVGYASVGAGEAEVAGAMAGLAALKARRLVCQTVGGEHVIAVGDGLQWPEETRTRKVHAVHFRLSVGGRCGVAAGQLSAVRRLKFQPEHVPAHVLGGRAKAGAGSGWVVAGGRGRVEGAVLSAPPVFVSVGCVVRYVCTKVGIRTS